MSSILEMPSLPEPDPVRYFLMNHSLYPELQQLGIRNGMSFVPFATGAKSLEEVEFLIIHNFPPRNDDILYKGIFHSKQDDRMPAERTWRKVLKCAVKTLGRHKIDEACATKFLMDKTMGANLIPFDNVCTWYLVFNLRLGSKNVLKKQTRDPWSVKFKLGPHKNRCSSRWASETNTKAAPSITAADSTSMDAAALFTVNAVNNATAAHFTK
jgi:hypothetical protein